MPNIKKVDLSLTRLQKLRDTLERIDGVPTGLFNYFTGLEEVVLPNTVIEI
ncbi:MAG: hypothetical protein K2L64_03200 [Ureaplasma sp.]|nr:hypothetical protein [Ureaplasma sp.]